MMAPKGTKRKYQEEKAASLQCVTHARRTPSPEQAKAKQLTIKPCT